MNPETKNCQNCRQPFTIEPDDFDFYKRIEVPAPTWCPECRMQRRLAYRNERSLYKRTCDMCKKDIIASYPADAPFPVYCRECWWSDNWEAASYFADYNFDKPFFQQFHELTLRVPRVAMWHRNAINSDFSNMVGESKNVYLSVSVISGSENVSYSKSVDASRNIVDGFNLVHCENSYENIEGEKNYTSHFMFMSRNCIDCRFLVDCATCKNCFMSSNLRNKEFYIRNKQYSKDEYFAELAKMNFGSRTETQKLLQEFDEMRSRAIYKFANILRSTSSTGNNLMNVKNVRQSFDVYNAENAKNCYRSLNFKDCMDYEYAFTGELTYEYTTGGKDNYQLKFAYSADSTRNSDYVDSCFSCNNVFGCAGLRKKEYAILNKTYSPDEFRDLRKRIIEQMSSMPYRDSIGRMYTYGEFFPPELNLSAYNESVAWDYWPLSKEEALAKGFRWRDSEKKTHAPTIDAIPDDIATIQDSILQEILPCAHEQNCNHMCSVAFRLTPDELAFYKNNSIPVPDKCPNCRHYERLAKTTPLKLWRRSCMCQDGSSNEAAHGHSAALCPNTFETPYAPERPEVVYCEQCYNAEIA